MIDKLSKRVGKRASKRAGKNLSPLLGGTLLAFTILSSPPAQTSKPTSQPEEPGESKQQIARERELGVMGTSLKIRVYGEDAARLDAAIDAAIAELGRVEDMMTSWRESPLTDMNAAAGEGPRKVPVELAAIISRAIQVSRLTGGAFDCSYAAVGKLWDFKAKPPIVPTPGEIRQQLEFVDSQRIKVDEQEITVTIPVGMSVGLGGIAKGYGVDRAMQILRDRGIGHAIVNAGGDMKVLGKDRGENWEVAIKHPRDKERAIAVLRVANTCVVSSGDYERFFMHDGKRYHHIIDPRTGYPSTGCMSATVVAQNAEYADALATAVCVLGPEEGLKLIEKLPRVEAIAVDMDGEVRASSGLKGFLVGASTGR